MSDAARVTVPRWPVLLLAALSLSIGWGIRGNFGHEFGAMLPGALAAMAIVLLSGREDWHRRVAFFAMFGALGWSFGGSMSYMQVVAYTHSGHSLSVLYGFACLFVIGFLWAAMGGAGTALAALLDRDWLTELIAPMSAVFAAWVVQELWLQRWVAGLLRANGYGLNWYDTDWLGTLVAILAVLLLAIVRRRWDRGSSLILHMAIGWWLAFLILVNGLGLRMTPPRGDNWSGCVGMVLGLWLYCARNRLPGVVWASLATGFLGGAGYAAATALKLVEITCGLDTNWHSIMEQTWGLFFGLGIAAPFVLLARLAPRQTDDSRIRPWAEVYAVSFTLLVITYLNLRKNPGEWVKVKSMPEMLYGLPPWAWFDLGYAALAAAVIGLLLRHRHRPLVLIPDSWLGKGQWLYLVLLWWMVVGNFERALVAFAPQRIVTEGVIHLNAVLCMVLALVLPPLRSITPPAESPRYGPMIRRVIAAGLALAAVSVVADWAVVRAIYGDRFAGYAGLHVRFGPRATIHQQGR